MPTDVRTTAIIIHVRHNGSDQFLVGSGRYMFLLIAYKLTYSLHGLYSGLNRSETSAQEMQEVGRRFHISLEDDEQSTASQSQVHTIVTHTSHKDITNSL